MSAFLKSLSSTPDVDHLPVDVSDPTQHLAPRLRTNSTLRFSCVQVQNIRKEGWVMKESAMIRTYRKRWLVLTPERLYSFKQEKKYHDIPTEEVDLKKCGTVKSADDLTNRQFTFTVQVPDRNFFLMAASDSERNEWVAAIGRATTESRRVRSYSEEVEYQEQQTRLAAAHSSNGEHEVGDDAAVPAPQRGGARFV